MEPTDGRVVVAEGQWWGGFPILATGAVQICLLLTTAGLLGGFVTDLRSAAFLNGFVLLCMAVSGLVFTPIWLMTAARVSYAVEGGTIVVARGQRVIARLDAAEYATFRVVDKLSVPRLFIPRATFLDPLAGLPYVVAEKRPNRWDSEHVKLPRILLFGRAAADGFEGRLLLALGRMPSRN